MKTLDWLKIAAVYVACVIGSATFGYLTGRATLGDPLHEFPLLNGALVATLFAARSNGPAGRPFWRLVLGLMALLAVLGMLATMLVAMTVGWRWGSTAPLEFAVPLSVAQVPLFVWLSRRRARAGAVADESHAQGLP